MNSTPDSPQTTDETGYLLASSENAKRLRRSIAQTTDPDGLEDASTPLGAMVQASGHVVSDSALILAELDKLGWVLVGKEADK